MCSWRRALTLLRQRTYAARCETLRFRDSQTGDSKIFNEALGVLHPTRPGRATALTNLAAISTPGRAIRISIPLFGLDSSHCRYPPLPSSQRSAVEIG